MDERSESVLIDLVRSVVSHVGGIWKGQFWEERPKLVRDGRTGFYFRSMGLI